MPAAMSMRHSSPDFCTSHAGCVKSLCQIFQMTLQLLQGTCNLNSTTTPHCASCANNHLWSVTSSLCTSIEYNRHRRDA